MPAAVITRYFAGFSGLRLARQDMQASGLPDRCFLGLGLKTENGHTKRKNAALYAHD
jgi:hypothetical protein